MAAEAGGALLHHRPCSDQKKTVFRPLLPPHHRAKEGHDSSPHRGLEGADSVSILQPLSLFNHRRYLQRVWSHVITVTTSSKSQILSTEVVVVVPELKPLSI